MYWKRISKLLCLASAAGLTTATAQTDFTKMPGTARAIGVGASGAVWVIGSGLVSGSADYNIFRWAGTQWQNVSGSGVKIAVDPNGNALVVNSAGKIYRYSFAGNPPWEQLPPTGANGSTRTASDVAVGPNAALWIIGVAQPAAPDQPIYHWTNEAWEQAPGSGLQIAVAPDGSPWVVNSQNELWERNVAKRTWTQHSIQLRAVAIGPNGAMFGVSTKAGAAGNYTIVQNINGGWFDRSIAGVAVAVGPTGEPWVLTAGGDIYRGTAMPASVIIGGDITVSTPDPGLTAPAFTQALPWWSRGLVPFTGGKMVCSGSACEATKADWVGPYTQDLTCDEGTYSLLYGGTCWGCPANDGLGNPWNINLLSLEEDGGCWRIPFPRFGPAKWVKLGWAWDCDGSMGEFWDTHNTNGDFVWGGSCWKCPDPEFPRRTPYWIAGPQACVTPIEETTQATLLSFNGCPRPDAAAMGLKGKREPGKPFLDVDGTKTNGIPNTGCFACPTVDESGDVLVTSRNATPLTDKNNNTACDINFRWTLPAFPEPGLSGLDGVKDILYEKNTLLRPSDVTLYLRMAGDARGMTDDQVDTFVKTEWQNIAASPYRSEIRNLVYSYIRSAISKTPADRTVAENKLLGSFADYVRVRRTFIAQQGLNMYDAWSSWNDLNRATTQGFNLSNLFYYGTVPLDFQKTLSTIATLGATGVLGVGAITAHAAFWDTIEYVKTTSQTVAPNAAGTYQLKGTSAVKNVVDVTKMKVKPESLGFRQLTAAEIFRGSPGAVALLSGASVIEAAFAVIQSIAIDQFIAIKTARPKLEAALAAADQPVDLAAILSQPFGEDILLNYWGKAMDAPGNTPKEADDPQLLTLAKAAYASASAKNFWP